MLDDRAERDTGVVDQDVNAAPVDIGFGDDSSSLFRSRHIKSAQSDLLTFPNSMKGETMK
jgi:hypothetical protein